MKQKKHILCLIGFHKAEEDRHIVVHCVKGKHKWHKNYLYCKRCGKLLNRISFKKGKVS